MAESTFEIRISGRVQGVGYRWFVREKALELGLYGYVKNMPDSSVLVVAHGDDQTLIQFSTHLRNGPAFAQVLDLDISESNEEILFKSFKIIR